MPISVIAAIANYDVSRILIDQGSSCDIMYNELFTKFRIEPDRLKPYHGGALSAFNDSPTQPIGSVTLPVMFQKEGDHTLNNLRVFINIHIFKGIHIKIGKI
jgi:hypothetical protein